MRQADVLAVRDGDGRRGARRRRAPVAWRFAGRETRGDLVSAAVAIVVQLAAFPLGRLAGVNNVMARMGTGAILRLLTIVVYALLVAKVLMLPLPAALVSMAAFFFLTTLIEPLLIKS